MPKAAALKHLRSFSFCFIITYIEFVETARIGGGTHCVEETKEIGYRGSALPVPDFRNHCDGGALSGADSQQTDRLFRESTAIAKAAPVVEALEHNGDTEYDAYLRNYLDIYIKSISNLDFVAVCEKDSTCRYYPNRAFVGRILTFGGEDRVLSGEGPYLVTVARSGYDLEMVYAPVRNRQG